MSKLYAYNITYEQEKYVLNNMLELLFKKILFKELLQIKTKHYLKELVLTWTNIALITNNNKKTTFKQVLNIYYFILFY